MISICAACDRRKKALVWTKHWFLGREFPIPITYCIRLRLCIRWGFFFAVLSSLVTCKSYITNHLPPFQLGLVTMLPLEYSRYSIIVCNCGRGPTEDIIHYFTLMSSELHYLDIILKIENLTLMSSASGKFDINVLSIWENHLSNTHIFVILPVLFLFSHILNASEQLQLLIYALLSLKCRELHLRVF